MIDYLKKINLRISVDESIFKKCMDIVDILVEKNYIAIELTYPAIVYIVDNKLATQDFLIGVFCGQERSGSGITYLINETRKINTILGEENKIRQAFCSSSKAQRRVRYNKIRALWESGKIIDLFNSYIDNLPKPLSANQRDQCIIYLKYMGEHNLNRCAIAIFPIIVYFVTASEIGFAEYAGFWGHTNIISCYIGFTKNDMFSIDQLLRRGHVLGYNLKRENIIPYTRIARIGIDLIRDKILNLPDVKIFRRDFNRYSYELSNGTETFFKNSEYQNIITNK